MTEQVQQQRPALLLVRLRQAFAAGTNIWCTPPLGQTTHRGVVGYVLPLHKGYHVPQCRAIVLCRDCYDRGMYYAWPEDCGQCAVAVAELTERLAHPQLGAAVDTGPRRNDGRGDDAVAGYGDDAGADADADADIQCPDCGAVMEWVDDDEFECLECEEA